MRLAFFGDVMGRSGRKALSDHLPRLRRRLALDFIVVNAENAAGGFGVTEAICEEIFDLGADVITTGNHAYDQRDSLDMFDRERRLLRPANFPASNPGRGAGLYDTRDGRSVLVVHLHGQRFMNPMDDPVPALEREMEGLMLGREADAIIVDMHAEASSEKYSLGQYLDGRVSLVVGTHTHVPTADTQIFPRGTAFQCDAGMCGDYDSVIGMEKDGPVSRFTTKLPGNRLQPASGEGTVCGVYVVTNDKTGLAVHAEPIRVGGRLIEQQPAPVER
ncbi:YmdB family metallophosphoesterase [Parvularcula flava]|uniref:Metallophosphoesterase n=1 Tax=Aquisalinus luteolus TaxID=1566827 RepID=A0A8J3A3Y8_9PROT|nr:TIGR00282 family metallophosphoesterase [Aquisalinus luteolus]NHK29279.1 YmdB family metallophosphoesterase [Aquisalinus luteolus]GGI01259.1 metallophosphoesterase [Aquisalinus luteolus]